MVFAENVLDKKRCWRHVPFSEKKRANLDTGRKRKSKNRVFVEQERSTHNLLSDTDYPTLRDVLADEEIRSCSRGEPVHG